MDRISRIEMGRMSRKHAEVLKALTHHMGQRHIEEASVCANHLLLALPHRPLHKNTVLVAYGGGKDSSYTVAFVRFIQLLLAHEHRDTFLLRIVTNRHAGMPHTVMENIDRAYQALGMYDDPAVELLLSDSNRVSLFCIDVPMPQDIIEQSRLDILMTGHRCGGEARPTFCNACNISMVSSFGCAATYNAGIDIIITGDSMKELRSYMAWIRRLRKKFGMSGTESERSFRSFIQTIDEIASHYFTDIYGPEAEETLQSHRITLEGITCDPKFFSIYQDTSYQAGEHWELLTKFLGFQFDEIAFSFTESDCANPALMAHLRGLKAERLQDRTYAEGVNEYRQFATELMRKKDFPAQLIEVMQDRYSTPISVQHMRDRLNCYAQERLDLSEEQLVCMLYSPFVQRGRNLALYLQREQPQLFPYLEDIHRLLAGESVQLRLISGCSLEEYLTNISHLSVAHLRTIYTMAAALHDNSAPDTPIAVVLSMDLHKSVITRRSGGTVVSELISGR